MLHTLLMIVHIVSATCIVALVLVQRGKGADAGAGFGAGASGTVFGARGATTALSRATAVLATVFMVTSLTLAYMGTRAAAPQSELERLATEAADSDVPAVPQAPADVPQATAPPADTAPVPQAPPAE
ncbi:MAG: preprotein translocase subunit SecG [Pseudomonadota bacterium]|nr:preprotein translocase subunit SecG [Pseudomonadota bacterium]